MKKFLTTCILISLYSITYAQISTNEQPISFGLFSTLRTGSSIGDIKTLPNLDMKSIEQEDRQDEQNGLPPRFG